jgi:ribosome-binding protein aMBF1 (putative translation factor)
MPGSTDPIGRRIANARKLRGLTQQQLADRVPCSKSLIAQVERGHKPASQASWPAPHAPCGSASAN